MKNSAFHGLRSQVSGEPRTLLCHAIGALHGLSYLGWMILILLLIDFALTLRYDVVVYGHDAKHVAQLIGSPQLAEQADRLQYLEKPDAGMLATVVNYRNHWFGPILEWLYHRVDWLKHSSSYAMALLVAMLGMGFFRLAIHLVQANLASRITMDITQRYLATQLNKFEMLSGLTPANSLEKLRENQTVTAAVTGLEQAAYDWFLLTSRIIGKMVALVFFIGLLQPWFGIVLLLLGMIAVLTGAAVTSSWWIRADRNDQKARTELARLLQIRDKARLLSSYTADDYFKQQRDHHKSEFVNHRLNRWTERIWIQSAWQFLTLTIGLALLALSLNGLKLRYQTLSESLVILAGMGSFLRPMIQYGKRERSINLTEKALDDVATQVFDVQVPTITMGNDFLDPPAQSIKFDRVSYTDPLEVKILEDVSFEIKIGERVAILATDPQVGRSIASLLMRFCEPTHGRLSIDDRPLQHFTFESIRAQLNYVPAEDPLFCDTVANNIGCGDIGFSFHKIVQAAKLVHAHQFIEKLPKGYHTIIGEGGFPISRGGAYQLSLARAVMRDRS